MLQIQHCQPCVNDDVVPGQKEPSQWLGVAVNRMVKGKPAMGRHRGISRCRRAVGVSSCPVRALDRSRAWGTSVGPLVRGRGRARARAMMIGGPLQVPLLGWVATRGPLRGLQGDGLGEGHSRSCSSCTKTFQYKSTQPQSTTCILLSVLLGCSNYKQLAWNLHFVVMHA